MRWRTRSEPERSTSMSMPGYSARNALATASATFTSTEVYQVTFASLVAAASIAGVVSWACAPGTRTQSAPAAYNRPSSIRFIAILQDCNNYGRDSAGETAAALRSEPHAHLRPCRDLQLRRRGNQDFLTDIDDVVAMAAQISLAAYHAGHDVVG